MLLNIVSVFLFVLVSVVVSEDIIYSNDFSVVSTSQRPSEAQKLEDRLSKVEVMLVELQTQLNGMKSTEINHQSKVLEQIQKELEIMNQQANSTKTKHFSDISEFGCKQYREELENVKSALKNLTQLSEKNQKLETLELQNNEIIQNVLKNMNSSLTEVTNLNTKLADYSSRLETVEQRNKQLQQELETVNTALTDPVNRDTKLNKYEARLEALELEIKKNQNKIVVTPKPTTIPPVVYTRLPRSCKEVKERGNSETKIYIIKPEHSSESFSVLCNMKVRGGGWTYVLKRFDGSQDFYLGWADYKAGFGSLSGEFWIGLEHLHQLTSSEDHELLIELVDWNLNKVHAHYDFFVVGSEQNGYYLKELGRYSGDAGDSLRTHVGMEFSTKDRDRDHSMESCANYHYGAWWYRACFEAHLTGKYQRSNGFYGASWRGFHGDFHALKEIRMLIKPKF